jgi:hypothetical protein
VIPLDIAILQEGRLYNPVEEPGQDADPTDPQKVGDPKAHIGAALPQSHRRFHARFIVSHASAFVDRRSFSS